MVYENGFEDLWELEVELLFMFLSCRPCAQYVFELGMT